MRSHNLEIRLPDPGLVENSATAEHCVHACFQMIFRTNLGGAVPSFDELDIIMLKKPGLYTWEHGLLARMPSFGFDTKIIWNFNLARLADDTGNYLIEHYGPEVGAENIRNSNLSDVALGARTLLQSDVAISHDELSLESIRELIADGYYILVTINQRTLQADPGYVAHNVFLYGYSSRGVYIHNPGPPSNAAAEIPWDLFDKAWSYPDTKARNIMAFRARGKHGQYEK